jgi:alkanesulfonate monooxygenase SsuD/methylene tetrahydromethanopterin reductase-like flavin-dependent oxidoreductase (luciferase family)
VTVLGAVFLSQLPPERLRSVVRAADESGLEELWLWEDCFRESGIATASAALAWSSRLRVGVGLLPVPLRNVAIAAMEVATLHRLFPGRVRIGVGHGVQDWMGQVGARVESPVTLLREYIAALKALLAGETVDVEGRYVHLRGVALDWPPPEAPEILAGAIGPKSMRVVGEVADAAIITAGNSPSALVKAKELVDAGSTAAGREPVPVVVYLHAATGPDAAARMEAERVLWGYDTIADRSVVGDAAAVAAAVRDLADAGADTVVLQPTPDDPDPEGFVRFTAHDVRPLVS